MLAVQTLVTALRKDGPIGVARKAWRLVKRRLFPFKDGVEGNMPFSVVPHKTRQVFIFASVPYYDVGGGQRSAQLAKTFFRLGYAVHYIFAQPSTEGKVYKIDIPTVTHRFVNNISAGTLGAAMKKGDIAIFEVPHKKFASFIPELTAKGVSIVYENIDNWETDLGNGLFSRETLVKLLQSADVFTATAKPLQAQLEAYLREEGVKKKVAYLPNAVDDVLFDDKKDYKRPKDLKGEGKVFLYYGSLWGQWFDWSLIEGIARKHSDITINLIGDSEHIKDRVAAMPKNVYFLGAKKQSALPAYLAHSDVALLPFKPDEIGEYVSPLKVFEYISMNKIVLATPLPDILNYPNVFTGLRPEDWNELIDSGIMKTARPKEQKAFVQANNWTGRCEAIVQAVERSVS